LDLLYSITYEKEGGTPLISWRRAVRVALSTLLWSVIWTTIGFGVIIAAGFIGDVKIVEGPFGIKLLHPEPAVLILAIVFGVFIIGLGWISALYKMLSEIMVDIVEGSFITKTQRLSAVTCPLCGAENQAGSRFCRNCGATIK